MNQPAIGSHIGGAEIGAIVAVYVVLLAFFIWCYAGVIRRAGYSGWWALMGFVPIGNLIMLGIFAVEEWPIRRELEYLRRHATMTGLPGYGVPHPPYGPGPRHGPGEPAFTQRPSEGPSDDPDAPRP